MISLTFLEAVPVIEPMGRLKNLVNRVTNAKGEGGGYTLTAFPSGWLVTHPASTKSKIEFPDVFVPNTNIRAIEGTEEELRAAYTPKAPPKAG